MRYIFRILLFAGDSGCCSWLVANIWCTFLCNLLEANVEFQCIISQPHIIDYPWNFALCTSSSWILIYIQEHEECFSFPLIRDEKRASAAAHGQLILSVYKKVDPRKCNAAKKLQRDFQQTTLVSFKVLMEIRKFPKKTAASEVPPVIVLQTTAESGWYFPENNRWSVASRKNSSQFCVMDLTPKRQSNFIRTPSWRWYKPAWGHKGTICINFIFSSILVI